MKTRNPILLIAFSALTLISSLAIAQVNVTVRVLPPYQSRITEYASRPDLMLLTLTNTSATPQQIQLTASISGDNGISAWIKPGYRSPRPIELAPGQALNLNGSDIAFLFDHNQIQYTGISQADFRRGAGLAEGTYQLCVQALDYATHSPISPEQPMGCTQFAINSAEPPTIIQPFDEQELRADGPQAFPITWSTPSGSSPLTQYKVKMVEIVVPRNPNDAMQSAISPPFFEESVTGNMLLYGPQHPQLTPGRQYALMVQAIDPYRTISFRNQGMSEVITFTYGSNPGAIATEGTAASATTDKQQEVAYATNRITGKLSWTFKMSEEKFEQTSILLSQPTSGSMEQGVKLQSVTAQLTSVGTISAPTTHMALSNTSLANHYLSHNPMQVAKSAALAQADPTLNGIVRGTTAVTQPAAEDIISSSGTSSIAYRYEAVKVDTGTQRYPLSNVVVTIKGIKPPETDRQPSPQWIGANLTSRLTVQQDIQYAGLRTASNLQTLISSGPENPLAIPQKVTVQPKTSPGISNSPLTSQVQPHSAETSPSTVVLATARTDASGNFSLQLLHPDYEGKNPYERLVVSVNAPGLEAFEYTLSIQQLDDLDLDLGELILLAKTYRFRPTITVEESEFGAITNPGLSIRIYRKDDEIQRYPHLLHEGMAHSGTGSTIAIGGKKYRLVASDSVAATGDQIKSIEFAVGRLFYQGSLYVEIEGLSGNVVKKITTLRVSDTGVQPTSILVVKPSYQIKLSRPAVQGEVILQAGTNMVPIAGAVLTVTYNLEDVLSEYSATPTALPSGVNQQASVAAISHLLGSQQSGVVKPSGASTVNATNTAAAMAINGTATAVSISGTAEQAITGSANGFTYEKVTVADAMMSEEALRNKYGRYTVKTDSTGQYRIGDLPVLKAGADYTIKIVSLPYNYRDMQVSPTREQSFMAVRGRAETRSFSIMPEVFNIVGRVIDSEQQGVPYARLHFEGGSTYFETGEGGYFQTSYYAGKHHIVVEKEGYTMKKIAVEFGIEKKDETGLVGKLRNLRTNKQQDHVITDVMSLSTPEQWIQSTQQTATVQQAIKEGYAFSPAMFGNASSIPFSGLENTGTPQPVSLRSGPHPGKSSEESLPPFQQQLTMQAAFSTQVSTTFRMNELVFASTKTHDLGNIGPLLPKVGKVRFAVVDIGTGNPLAEARIQLFDTTQVVDNRGQWLYEGFGGHTTVTVTPLAGSGYVPLQLGVDIFETGEITEITLALEKGIRVHGQVRSSTQGIAGAGISIEGRSYLSTISGLDGEYELYVPSGEQVIRAAKAGYVSHTENRILNAGSDVLINFSLGDGGGRNISTLLGFEIELDEAIPDGAGERWAGRFIRLRPNPSLFGEAAEQSLPFSNARVTFDAKGNALPDGGEVVTDVFNLPLKVLGFLPVTLGGGQEPLKVVLGAQGNGSISGQIKLASAQIQGSRGFVFPASLPLLLNNDSEAPDIEVFRAGKAQEIGEVVLRFAQHGGTAEMDLYGFKFGIDLAASRIHKEGLQLVGTLNTPALGPISSANVKVEALRINTDLRIQQVTIKTTDLPTLKIGGWEAALSNVLFNENGFKLGGRMKITIPQSGESNVEFNNLSLGKDAMYGGQFTFPGGGLNVYNIVKLTSGGKPLAFGRVGNLQVYSLGGSAKMKFDKLITKEITIPSFQVQTDGRFMLQAPVDHSADLAFAKFNIKNLTVSTLSGQMPFISIQGEFNVNFKGLKFEVADVRFTANPRGGADYSVGTIGGELAVPLMKVAVRVGLKENGFEGGGSLGIPGTPINADVNFHYYKTNGGVDIGASFKSGVIIPIGIVELNKISGGFAFNTANGKFMVNINGGASITGLSTLVNLEPISLTVTDGPIIIGEAGVKIANAFELVKAKMELNFPAQSFAINVDSDIEPIKGVARSRLHGLLRIKWDPREPYVFLGVNTEVNVLGFFKSYGEYAMGINISDPKYRKDDISGYFRYLDDGLYARGGSYRFSGVYLHAKTEIGVPKERAVGIDLKIVSGKAWFHSYTDVMLLLNFAQNDYQFRLAGGLSTGAEGCIGPGCIGVSFSACYAFTGGFREDWGWFLNGKAGGFFGAHIGKKCDCNELCIIGGRICVGAHAFISIRTRGSSQFSVGLGQEDLGNSCL